MNIIINGKEAVLKKGVSFDFISENSLFTGADSYSLSITFPLEGCRRNIEIFGYINRKDCDIDRVLLDCEMHDGMFHAYGAVNIVEISDKEVKTQFLEGRSVQNYASDLDELYINEIAIGEAWTFAHFTPDWYTACPGQEHYCGYICIPWVNNTSGNMQNRMYRNTGGSWAYVPDGPEGRDDPTVACQFFLVWVLERVIEAAGYTADISSILNSSYRHLVIFNTFPVAWNIDEWGLCLPHWTVTEFLEQLEFFLNGSFLIDAKAKKISFRFHTDMMSEQQTYIINNVVDEHQVEISDRENVQESYVEQMNLAYSEASHNMQKFYDCDWARLQLGFSSYASFDGMKSSLESLGLLEIKGPYPKSAYLKKLLYVSGINTFFVLNCYKMSYNSDAKKVVHYMRLQPVNLFAPRFPDTEEKEKTELGIVPVCIDYTDDTYGDAVFLECGTYGDVDDNENEEQSLVVNALIDGKKEQKEEFYDKIYVGFWNGLENTAAGKDNVPLPWIDNYFVTTKNVMRYTHMLEPEDFSMRLRGAKVNGRRTTKYKIDQSKKYTFKFIVTDNRIPDVQSVFLIHGKKYLAEKITATFSETGMSQLLKMVAYRIS